MMMQQGPHANWIRWISVINKGIDVLTDFRKNNINLSEN